MLGSKLLGERYQVVKVLSEGAFCHTYMVEDTYLSHRPNRVIKHFLPRNRYSIPVEIRRRLFNREVEALKQLSNSDLVPHLLADFEDNLEFYLVQEFIEGHPLSEELSRGRCWSETKVFQLLQEILGILDFVHSYGLIHRDVKPSNIIRRKQDNRLVLIDFGAVKPIWNQLIIGQRETSIFTSIEQYTTIAIGTPGYMPNEQQRGKPHPNSDIYALGMIGIQALTGVHPTQLPEDPNTGEVIWQNLVQVSPGLASVLNKMVRYHFQDRYKSAKEALKALWSISDLYQAKQEFNSTTFNPQTFSYKQDTNKSFESNVSSTVSNQTSDNMLPDTLLPITNIYPPMQELAPNILQSYTPSLGKDTNQIFGEHLSSSLLDNQTSKTNISIISQKSPLLIGLIVGAVSGLVLMVVSYWFVQIISPDPKIENLRIQTPKKSLQ
ncbi:serine/threonine protein kinase [Nostoc sp. CENA67]|uniref:non-specific serine/threonine protein kinase n=1 Tax=Amazonocrinis nigriterrae CENA67 TaxID=2794033 RepID=A0A8J7HRF3_9NOST|nr:serine/threonine-protein kinase [Amazonocrinis nigriterrae]MBH8564581.1 serine/threonine protein kinase [Amazonocrinis nigriterrae CENA67]